MAWAIFNIYLIIFILLIRMKSENKKDEEEIKQVTNQPRE